MGHSIYLNYYDQTTQVRGCPSDGRLAFQLCNIVDASGQRYLDVRYDSSDHLSTVRDPLGRTLTYLYSGGDLASVDIRDANTAAQTLESYTYGDPNHLLLHVNRDGYTQVANVYDDQKRVANQQIRGATTITYGYAKTATEIRTTVTATGLGVPTDVAEDVYRLDGTLREQWQNGRRLKYLTFDPALAISSTTDANGHTTVVDSNAQGQPTKVTNALSQTTTLTYDTRNRLFTVTDPSQRVTRYTYTTDNVLAKIEQDALAAGGPAAITTITTNVRYPGRRLIEDIQDAEGHITHFTYNAAGDVIEIVNGYGTPEATRIVRAYDLAGRMTDQTSAAGSTDPAVARTTHMVYTLSDTLSQQVENYVAGASATADTNIQTSYSYTPGTRLLAAITNPDSTSTFMYYDYFGRLSSMMFDSVSGNGTTFRPSNPADNITTAYQYDGFSRLTDVTETGLLTGTVSIGSFPRFSSTYNRVTHTAYDAWSHPVTVTLNYKSSAPATNDTNIQLLTRYDAVGNQTATCDPMRCTRVEYDVLNRPITTTVNLDDGNPTTGDPAYDRINTLHYDSVGRVDQRIDLYVNGVYDPTHPDEDRITTYGYNRLDQIVTTTANRDDGNPATGRWDSDLVSSYAYDRLGHITQQTDPLTRGQRWEYNALGQVTKTIQNYGDGNHSAGDAADVDITTLYRYDALGQLRAKTDVADLTTTYSYDGMGRLQAQVVNAQTGQPQTNEVNVTTSYGYNAMGVLVNQTAPNGEITTVTVDKLGRPTKVRTQISAAIPQIYVDTSYAYDGQGTMRSQAEPGKQWSVSLTDPLGRTTASIDSYSDGLTSASEPDTDIVTRQSYDKAGRVLQTTDPNGVATQYDYDVNDQIRQIVANVQDRVFNPTTAVDTDVPTWLRYDRAGNQIEVKDANNHLWQTSYDALDQQIGTRDPLNHGPALTYDRGGRVRQQQRADGALVQYDYDLADRLTLVQAPDPLQSGQAATTSYTYRPDGARISMVDVQQGTTSATTYGYDTLKRLTAVTEPSNSTTNYRYNAAGQRDQMRYPDGTTLDYRYSVAGMLQSVSQNNVKLADYSWSSGKLLSAKLRDGGTTLQYDYDSLRRQTRQWATGLNAPSFDIKTTYDRLGQPIRVEETLAEGTSAPIATATSNPASPTASPTATGSTATRTATASATATSATATASATATSSVATATNTVGATNTATVSASATRTASAAATATATASATPVPASATRTATPVPATATATATSVPPTATRTATPVPATATATATSVPPTATRTATPVPATATAATPTRTATASATPTSAAATATRTATASAIPSATATTAASATTAPSATATSTSGGSLFYAVDLSGGQYLEAETFTSKVGSQFRTISTDPTRSNGQYVDTPDITTSVASATGSTEYLTYDLDVTNGSTVNVYLLSTGSDNDSDSFWVAVDGINDQQVITGSPGTWTWKKPSSGTFNLPTGSHTLTIKIREDGAQVDKIYLTTGSTAPTGLGGTALTPSFRAGVSGDAFFASLRVPGTSDGLGITQPLAAPLAPLAALTTQTRVITYSYDGLQRMTGAFESPGTSATYRYDPVGNRLAQTVNGSTTASTYDIANQLLTVGGRSYQYDLNGQVTNDGLRQFTFDARDRLVKWTQGSATQTFTYNGDDVLTAQTADGIQTQYTQDVAAALPQVLQTRRGGTTTNQLYGLGRIGSVTSSTPTWNLTDQLGTGRLTLDSSGTAQASFRTNAFGTPQDGTQPAPFGFTGELQDPASGLTYLRARWYDPQTARFLSRDPVAGFAGQPSSFNPYQYAYHSPQRFTDPSGQFIPVLLAMLGGALLGGGFNYGYQVFQNYQHGLRGGQMFTSICTQEVLIAAMSGAVGGAVGYMLGPITAILTRTGFVGSLLAGALEGASGNVAATALIASLTGQPITPGMLFRSGVEGGIGGTVGGGLGWMARRLGGGIASPARSEEVSFQSWHPGMPGAPSTIKLPDERVPSPLLYKLWGHPTARSAPASLEGFIERVFDNDIIRYESFLNTLDTYTPPGVTVAIKGSSVGGYKWVNGQPFDAKGPLTSDMDMVLVGREAQKAWSGNRRYFGLLSDFLSADPKTWANAPQQYVDLLQAIENQTGRSVNFLSTGRIFFQFRHAVQRLPYLILSEK